MSTWAQRVHRRAADLGSVVTSCGHPGPGPYPYRLEKVKFGVPLNEVCKNDIPGPLLVLILKLNKEAPQRKDVFRAPGNQSAMKKLIHFLQAGRLVNVDNFSVYTIASVLKKFLRKIPNGIFGRNGEDELFAIIDIDNDIEQQERIHRLITSLPIYTQRLLVLLFGTFRVIASNAERAGTGMSSEALGVSVAPSFFQSCVSDGKTARMEDVLRYKVATRIMKKMIDQFATFNLFGRENYEFYARVTGRILKVEDEWICSFRFPPPPRGELAQQHYALQLSLEAGKTWLQCECERWGLIAQEESQSTPALLTSSSSAIGNSALSIGIIPELSLLESCARLSVSLEGPGVFAINSTGTGTVNQTGNGESTTNIELSSSQSKIAAALAAAAVTVASTSAAAGSITTGYGNTSDKRSSFSTNTILQGSTGLLQSSTGNNGMKHSSSCSSTHSSKSASAAGSGNSNHHMTMDELRAVNRYAESTKSLSYLPQFNIDTTTSSSTTQLHVTSSHKHQSQSSSHHQHNKITPLLSTSLLSSSLLSSSSSSLLLTPLVVNNFIAGRQPDNIDIKNSCCVIIDSIEKVHERQTQRMKTRSEWFLESGVSVGCSSLELSQYNSEFFGGSHNDIQDHHNQLASANTMFLMLHQAQQQQHQQNHLHPHHLSSWQHNQHLQQQQPHIDYLQRMDTSADEQDSLNNTANNQHHTNSSTGCVGEFNRSTNPQQQQQPSSMMFLMDTNFPPMSVGNIGLSASAESVQYPVKRPSRRGPSYTRHHPHRSSSHRNKENGKTLIGNQANSGNGTANGSGTGSGGGPGNNGICTVTTTDAPTAVRSNSFRQKKSNREYSCSDSSSTTGTKLLRKSRAVSFETTKTNILLPHPKVCLTPASKICDNNSGGDDCSGHNSINENCETIILMDTTEESSSSILLQSIILDSQLLTNSNSSINNLNTNSIQTTKQQKINNTGISTSSNTSIDKLSTNLLTSSPSLHFKPPRV